MTEKQIGIIGICLTLSVISLVVPVLIYFLRKIIVKALGISGQGYRINKLLVFSGCLVFSIWFLRYAVGYYSLICAENVGEALKWWEEIFNSFVHTLQTFSMDEEYTVYITKGREMLSSIFNSDDSGWITVYGLYASLLNFIAPIAGGAIIFEMLVSIFPRIKLSLSYLAFWKEKYFFSELNNASLALAKSIYKLDVCFLKRPIIVFTDAYSDDDSEKKSKLLFEARLIGAICIKDDLSHTRKNMFGMRKFFLIDEVEENNLRLLANLSDDGNIRYLKKSEIYLFTNDDAYVQVEKRVRDKLSFKQKFKEEEFPVFIPVQSYRNLISNLLVDIPLYEPIIGKEKDGDGKRTLTVAIFGTGHIGTEMFLSAYWLGQILDCKLKINVISQESKEAFWSKIDYVNPEIRHTTIKGDPILRINRKGDLADVYCEVEYFQCDVKSSELISCLVDGESDVLNSDYILVSLGNDADNISFADTLRRYIGQHHISVNKTSNTVIAYVVYNPELSDVMNRKNLFSSVKGREDIYMKAIGNLRDVYSVRNVFLTEHEYFAQKSYEAYLAVQNREGRAKTYSDRIKDEYKYWANLARAMHTKYKVFSFGFIKDSIFDCNGFEDVYYQKLSEAYSEYKKVVSGQFEFKSDEQAKKHLEMLHKMAWLEHRRWNAFTRVKGFRHTNDYDAYAVPGVTGSYKQMDIKLHPCLVECDQNGIKASVSPKGEVDESTLFKCCDTDSFDLLDDLSYDLYSKKYNDYDFKRYDYPISDS